MAERRMFAKTIIDSDAFLDMPLSTQALYFHLSMRADDEGFINNPKKIKRMIGSGRCSLRAISTPSGTWRVMSRALRTSLINPSVLREAHSLTRAATAAGSAKEQFSTAA